MSNDAYIGFKLPESQKLKLQEMAWFARIQPSRLLRQIVEDYLTKQEEVKKEAVDKDHSEVRF